jgi:hypothetical protein
MIASISKPPAKVYRLRIRPVDPNNDAGTIRHLRLLLKTLLRRHGFRCVEVVEERTHPVVSGRMG